MTIAEPKSALAAFAELRGRRGADPALLAAARDVVVVAGSSRGGSTMVGELLRRVPGTIHLRAESNPLVAVAGDDPATLAAELSVDLGAPAPAGDGDDVVDTLVWRLLAQWPDLALDPDDVRAWAERTLAEVRFTDTVGFHLSFLAEARRHEPAIDPWYYDLPASTVRRAFPGVPEPEGPAGATVLEMAPFVLVRPWARATADDLHTGTVVLTTPRNSFRLPLLRSLFPNARLRVLHLTRNPAAAVNGLVDGWRHRGFFSGPVDVDLAIEGYTDDARPWTRRWWNFDQWPGWEGSAGCALPVVCARQWAAPHVAVLETAAALGLDRHVLRFEDVAVADRQAFADLADWLGRPEVTRLTDVRLPPLMATATPAPRRWSRRAGEVLSAVTEVHDLAADLGYDDPITWR